MRADTKMSKAEINKLFSSMKTSAKLNKNETRKALTILKTMYKSETKHIRVYEVRAHGQYLSDSSTKYIVMGVVVVRVEKENCSFLEQAFVQDFCITEYGLPVFFEGEGDKKAIIDWRIVPVYLRNIKPEGEDEMKYLSSHPLLAVIEPLDTENQYFGELNHFIKNSDKRVVKNR